jgi:rfaE bifunctional protein kinase chain/domain
MQSSEIRSTAVRTSLPPRLSKTILSQRIRDLSKGRVIVVGDLLIDELLEGSPERISREAPVLILEHVDTQLIPGGAANTANNIAALGGNCHAIGVCGQDEYASKLASLFDRAGISHGLTADSTRPTTVKTRILSKSHSFRQQLLRLDRISHEPINKAVEALLTEKIQASASDYQAIVLSDYKGGVITDGIINICRSIAQKHNLKLVVDAQNRFERFQDVAMITPNQPDTEQVVGFPINSKESLERAGQQVLQMTRAEAVLITRGAHGMALFERNQAMCQLPVFNRSEVFDVSGAGDTVIATMALALVTGSSYLEAMALGNLAAGIVVRKPGTDVTSQSEMLETLDGIALEE